MKSETPEYERLFVENFVIPEKQSRVRNILARKIDREKFGGVIAHGFDRYVQKHCVFKMKAMPDKVRDRFEKYKRFFSKNNPEGLCHVISDNPDLDGELLPLGEIEERREYEWWDAGMIVILLSHCLALYFLE